MLADVRRALADDGVAVVRQVLDAAWCARLREAIERCRARPGPHYGVLSAPEAPVVDSDLFRWSDDPTLHELTHDSPLTALAAGLLGTDEVVLVEDQWFASEPGARTASPWHQDDPYYNLDRPFVTIWITLDDVGADASLRAVPRSHAAGTVYAPVEFATSGSTIGAGSEALTPVPDVDGDPARYPVVAWDLRAGDAAVLDSRTLHATGISVVDRPYRRISTRWAAPATRYVDRGEHVARFWTTIDHGLRNGDLLASEAFPLIRPG